MGMHATMNRRGSRTPMKELGSIKLGLFKKAAVEIRDLSPGGARIVAPEGVDLPETFILNLPGKRRSRDCIVRWQSGNEIGVEFTTD